MMNSSCLLLAGANDAELNRSGVAIGLPLGSDKLNPFNIF